MHEQASHLAGGKWLILSRCPQFTLKEISMNDQNARVRRTFKGCKSCTNTVACNTYIEGPNIRLRPDFTTCTEAPANSSYHTLIPSWDNIFVNFAWDRAAPAIFRYSDGRNYPFAPSTSTTNSPPHK